jgi:general secretion pathway protein E
MTALPSTRVSLPQRPKSDENPTILRLNRGEGEQFRVDGAEGVESESNSPSFNEAILAWARTLGIPFWADLRDQSPFAEFVERVPIGFARRYGILVFSPEASAPPESPLPAVISNLDNWPMLDVVGRYLKQPLLPVAASEEAVLAAINHAYQRRESQSASLVEVLDPKDAMTELEEFAGQEDLLDSQGSPPVIRLVNSILFEAVKARASDVHVQPMEECLVVRQRIDGVLFDTIKIPKNYQEEVLSRLKVLGRMNIAEKRLPQDGRATVQFGDRFVDLRIASLPTSFGERVVVRFLDKSARLYTLDELGMSSNNLGIFRALIKREHGILLTTGPTGSGKSTTLYAALQEINSKTLNVLTLEDPIEYQLDGISQTQINQKKGLTFASGLRNVLRQDPDIIMVGEIRDQETAVMAIQSALTGHLVFSTLHTNDAATAITRLLDLGIEPFLVASSVIAVVAQRLIRRTCPHCREPWPLSDEDLLRLGVNRQWLRDKVLYRSRGCSECRKTGYLGRLGIFEVLSVTDTIRELIQSRANASQIRAAAVREGMQMLCDDGLRKAVAGESTIEEVLRVTAND